MAITKGSTTKSRIDRCAEAPIFSKVNESGHGAKIVKAKLIAEGLLTKEINFIECVALLAY